MTAERPTFLSDGVFSWSARGYRYSGTPPMTLMSPSALEKDNPWIVLAAVLERALSGEFETLPYLINCIRDSDNPVIWRTCFDLLGDAGSMPIVKSVVHEFREEVFVADDVACQRHVCYALSQSMYLWAVPLMLDIYLHSSNRRESGIITVLLSRLLEEEFGEIATADLPDNEYRELVMKKFKEIIAAADGDDGPVLYGQKFSVKSLVMHLYTSLQVERPDRTMIQHDRHLFEAATGINCFMFFEKGQLRSSRALAIVEDFLMSGRLKDYEDGVRYFNSIPIP